MKDNTLLYVGLAGLAFYLYSKKTAAPVNHIITPPVNTLNQPGTAQGVLLPLINKIASPGLLSSISSLFNPSSANSAAAAATTNYFDNQASQQIFQTAPLVPTSAPVASSAPYGSLLFPTAPLVPDQTPYTPPPVDYSSYVDSGTNSPTGTDISTEDPYYNYG